MSEHVMNSQRTPEEIARSIIMDSEGRYTSEGCEERIAEAIRRERDRLEERPVMHKETLAKSLSDMTQILLERTQERDRLQAEVDRLRVELAGMTERVKGGVQP